MLEYNIKLNEEFIYIEDLEEKEWEIERNKYNFYSVLNSKDNTQEELRKFIKEHTIYDYTKVSGLTAIFICLFLCVLQILNTFIFESTLIRYFVLGGLFINCIELLIRTITNNHNWNVKDKIMEEDIEYIKEKKKHDKKRTIPKNKENK